MTISALTLIEYRLIFNEVVTLWVLTVPRHP